MGTTAVADKGATTGARVGRIDMKLEAVENWPDWYAAYIVAEQSGTELLT